MTSLPAYITSENDATPLPREGQLAMRLDALRAAHFHFLKGDLSATATLRALGGLIAKDLPHVSCITARNHANALVSASDDVIGARTEALQKALRLLLQSAARPHEPEPSDGKEFVSRSTELWQRCRERGEALTMVLIEIEPIPAASDKGQNLDDPAAVFLGRLLASSIRGDDLVGRWDTFVYLMILPSTSIHGAKRVCERVMKRWSTEAQTALPGTTGTRLPRYLVAEAPNEADLWSWIERYHSQWREQGSVAPAPRPITRPSEANALVLTSQAACRNLLTTILRQHHCLAHTEPQLTEAVLKDWTNMRFHLAFVDEPDKGGDTSAIVARLREDPRTRRLPVLATVSDGDPSLIDRTLAAGASDVIRKPYIPERLHVGISHALSISAPILNSGTVLLLEHRSDVHRLARTLTSVGLRVLLARDTSELLARWRNDAPSAIVAALDLIEDPAAMLASLRAHADRQPPFVVFTTVANDRVCDSLRDYRSVRTLRKPVDAQTILATLPVQPAMSPAEANAAFDAETRGFRRATNHISVGDQAGRGTSKTAPHKAASIPRHPAPEEIRGNGKPWKWV